MDLIQDLPDETRRELLEAMGQRERAQVESMLSYPEDSAGGLMNMAGLDEEDDMFAPVLTGARRRAVWLGINLLTAFLAARVIGRFEGALEKVVALAVLMPIFASRGGIAGSQTLTLMIRGLALGHVECSNASLLLWKEVGIGALNGLIWVLVVAALAIIWFGSWEIGGIIAAAILLNLLCAALAGVGIPPATAPPRHRPCSCRQRHPDHRHGRGGFIRLPRVGDPAVALSERGTCSCNRHYH